MSEVYSKGYASKTMPEDYVYKLAKLNIVTVNHRWLTQSLEWPEYKDKLYSSVFEGRFQNLMVNQKSL